jgi:hypothetical protein
MTRHSRMAAALAVVLAGACATSLPHRLDLRYDANPADPVPGAPRLIVGLAPTHDARGLADPGAIGRRVTMDNQVEPMIPAGGRPEALVTEALRTRLTGAGYTVRQVAAWDLRPETLDPSWGDLVVGSELLDFWTEAKSESLRPTRIDSRARVRLVVGSPQEGRILWTNTVESASQQDVTRFTPSAAAANANEALGSTIRALVESPELRERLAAAK